MATDPHGHTQTFKIHKKHKTKKVFQKIQPKEYNREAIDIFGRPWSGGQKVSVSPCGSVANK